MPLIRSNLALSGRMPIFHSRCPCVCHLLWLLLSSHAHGTAFACAMDARRRRCLAPQLPHAIRAGPNEGRLNLECFFPLNFEILGVILCNFMCLSSVKFRGSSTLKFRGLSTLQFTGAHTQKFGCLSKLKFIYPQILFMYFPFRGLCTLKCKIWTPKFEWR